MLHRSSRQVICRAKEQQAAQQQLVQQRHAAAATEQALRSSLEEATDEVIDLRQELRMSHARLQELEGQLHRWACPCSHCQAKIYSFKRPGGSGRGSVMPSHCCAVYWAIHATQCARCRMQRGVPARQGLGCPVQQAAITPVCSLEDSPPRRESRQHLQLGVQRLQAQRQARQQGPQSSGRLMTHCQPLTGMEWGRSDAAAWAAQSSRSLCSGQQLAYAERARDAASCLGMGRGQTGMQAACASVLQQPSLTSDWQAPPRIALLRDCRGNSSQPMLNWSPSCAAEHQSGLPYEHAVEAGLPGAALYQVQEELNVLHQRLQVSLQPHCMTCRLLYAVLESASVL